MMTERDILNVIDFLRNSAEDNEIEKSFYEFAANSLFSQFEMELFIDLIEKFAYTLNKDV